MPMNTAGSGWITARLSIHGSRGRTQQIESGSTPLCSSQTQASVAVLPAPTITNSPGALSSLDRSLTGIARTESATAKGGGVVAGMSGAR